MQPAAVLSIIVDANTKAANASLAKTDAQLRGTAAAAGATTTASSRAATGLKKLGTVAKWAGLAVAAGFVIEAKKAVTTTQDLTKSTILLHKNLGLTNKQASEWAGLAKARGADTKQLGMAFKTLSIQITAARSGSETSIKMFKRLGFSQQDIAKSSHDTEFAVKKVADGLQNLSGGADKAAITGKLFGRGWVTIAPILRDGSKAMQEQLDTVEKYGGVLEGKTLKDQEKLLANIRENKIAWQGFQIQLATAVTPALNKVSDQFQEIAAINARKDLTGEEKWKRISKILQRDFRRALDVIVKFIPVVAEHVGQAAPKIAGALVKGFLSANIWGKLFIGAWFIKKLGGWGLITALGSRFGTRMGGPMATSTVETATTGKGGIPAKLRGKTGVFSKIGTFLGKPWGAAFGAAAAAAILIIFHKQIENWFKKQGIPVQPDQPLGAPTPTHSGTRHLGTTPLPFTGGDTKDKPILHSLAQIIDKYGSVAQAATQMGKKSKLAFIEQEAAAQKDGFLTKSHLLRLIGAMHLTRSETQKALQNAGLSLDDFSHKSQVKFGLVGGAAGKAGDAVHHQSKRIGDATQGAAKAAHHNIGKIIDAFGALGQVISGAIDDVQRWARQFAKAGPKGQGRMASKAGHILGSILGGQRGGVVTAEGIQHFAVGGTVGTDTVPAMLTPGEFVMRREAVSKIGAKTLSAMNKGISLDGKTGEEFVAKTKKVAKDAAKVIDDNLGKGNKDAADDTQRFVKHHGDLMDKLKDVAAKTTDRFRKGTLDDFQKTSSGASQTTQRMQGNVSNGMDRMRDHSLSSTQKMRQGVSEDFHNMAGAVGNGINKIAAMTNKALKALGVNKVNFGVSVDKGKGKQRGGHITAPGAPSVGDHIPAMLEKNEYVVNSKAARKHRDLLDKINFEDAPRFQTGGVVDRTGVQHFAKGGMAAMVAEVNKFERHHFPYRWGGGHSSFGIQPVDCSGFVSDVLHVAGLLKAPMVSGSLMSWGKPGKGPLTVYASPSHTVLSLDGRFAGTSSSNPGGGAGWIENGSPGLVSGGVSRTMDVAGAIAGHVARILMKGPKGPMTDMAQAALDKIRGAANRYIDRKTPAGAFGGGQALNEMFKGGKLVGASSYGFGEAGTGTVGASGVDLRGKMAFAELDMGTALGHLPFGSKLRIGYKGKSIIGEKLDIGAGGGDVKGHHRAIDLWKDLANAIGFGVNLDLVKIKKAQKGGLVAPYVGKFHEGGPVMQNGLGMLERGEQVIPKMQAGGVIRPPRQNFAVLPFLGRLLHGMLGLPSAHFGHHARHRFHRLHAIHRRTDAQQKELEDLRDRRRTSRLEQRQIRTILSHGGPTQIQKALRFLRDNEVKWGKRAEKQLKDLERQRRHGHLDRPERHQLHRLERRHERHEREVRMEKLLEQRLAQEKELIAQNKEMTGELKQRNKSYRVLEGMEGVALRALMELAAGKANTDIGFSSLQKRRQAAAGSTVRY